MVPLAVLTCLAAAAAPVAAQPAPVTLSEPRDLSGPAPWCLALGPRPVVRLELFCEARPPDGAMARATFGAFGYVDIPLGQGWSGRRIPRLQAREMTIAPPAGVAPTEARLAYAPDPPEPGDAAAVLARLDLPPWSPPPAPPRPNARCGMMTSYFEHGFADAFEDGATGWALDAALARLGCTALRFPGGSWAYGYVPFDRRCLKVYADAKMGFVNYSYWDLPRWGWVGAEAFLRRCARLGLTAWYQLDPGFYCDGAEGKAYQLADFDRGKNVLPVSAEARRKAIADVERLARVARSCGADVVWEVGNEDYCYYSPGAYAGIVADFAGALRRVDPAAKIAACGDSISWSDLSWQAETGRLLAARGLPDFWSVHLYLQGMWMPQGDTWVPRPWNTQVDVMTHTLGAWEAIHGGFYSHQYRDNLWVGGRRPPLVITECNVFAAGDDLEPKGHWTGRAVGEAAAWPSMAGLGEDDPRTVGVFFHDLVRSGEAANWFQRLDYYPGLVPRLRYGFQADAEALALVARHGRGRLLAHRDLAGLRVVASAVAEGYWVTAVNVSPAPAAVSLTAPAGGRAEVTVLGGGEGEYDYGLATRPLKPEYAGPSRTRWRLIAPAASVTAMLIRR